MARAIGPAQPRRWSIGVRIVAVGWVALLFSAYLNGEISVGFIYGTIASAVYWTVGSFLAQAGRPT